MEFKEVERGIKLNFGELYRVSDGGFEQGYEQGLAQLRARCDLSIVEYQDKNLTTLGDYAFFSCSQLRTVDIPNCTTIGNYAFQYCSAIEYLSFPNVVTVGQAYSYAFSRCSNLKTIDFGKAENIGGYAFQLCGALETLIIRTPTVCSLGGVSAINSSGIHNKNNATIYVPDELVEEYKVATNWSNYASKIKPLSELGE